MIEDNNTSDIEYRFEMELIKRKAKKQYTFLIVLTCINAFLAGYQMHQVLTLK